MAQPLDETAWYHSTFTEGQRAHIGQIYQPLAQGGAEDLLIGPVEKVVCGLGDLIGWFDNPRDRDEYAVPMTRRLADLLDQFAPNWTGSIERLHFAYQSLMDVAYKLRAQPGWLELVAWAARAQVAIAPQVAAAMRADYPESELPVHGGFDRLAILADGAGADDDVIQLSRQAREQGWAGSWDQRIAKAETRRGPSDP